MTGFKYIGMFRRNFCGIPIYLVIVPPDMGFATAVNSTSTVNVALVTQLTLVQAIVLGRMVLLPSGRLATAKGSDFFMVVSLPLG